MRQIVKSGKEHISANQQGRQQPFAGQNIELIGVMVDGYIKFPKRLLFDFSKILQLNKDFYKTTPNILRALKT